MIYIQEKNFDRQIELLSFLSEKGSYSICAWLYPESSLAIVAGQLTEISNLEAVTTYDDGKIPSNTVPVECNKSMLSQFLVAKAELIANCDSLVLYKSSSKQWSVAAIGHEGICLVRDDALLTQLLSAGFSGSFEAPSWW
jgi:hypothetical protein